MSTSFLKDTPPILTATLLGFTRSALEIIRDEFAVRYPEANCIVRTQLQGSVFRFEITHLARFKSRNLECTIGSGETPEAAFAHLEEQLGPLMSEPERLRWKARQLMQEAEEMETKVVPCQP